MSHSRVVPGPRKPSQALYVSMAISQPFKTLESSRKPSIEVGKLRLFAFTTAFTCSLENTVKPPNQLWPSPFLYSRRDLEDDLITDHLSKKSRNLFGLRCFKDSSGFAFQNDLSSVSTRRTNQQNRRV